MFHFSALKKEQFFKIAEENPNTMEGLREAIKRCWTDVMTVSLCRKLIDRMGTKMREVLRVRGAPTRIG